MHRSLLWEILLKCCSKRPCQIFTSMFPAQPDKILDLCYRSIKNAYKSVSLPPLGSADHNCGHLLPILKKEKVKTVEVAEDSLCAFRNALPAQTGTLVRTLVMILINSQMCVALMLCSVRIWSFLKKTVNIYPNNKPWVTRAVKCCLEKKRLAFQQGSLADQHSAENWDFKSKKCL